jgi:hypothetical protein
MTLTKVIQGTIEANVSKIEIIGKTKRWWTKELMQLRKKANKTGRQSYKRRTDPAHDVHEMHNRAVKDYRKTLEYTKRNHWRDWLEKADDPDIWTVNRLIAAPASDGGKTRIPTLKYKVNDTETIANTNSEKTEALAKSFFPPKPQHDEELHPKRYPKQCAPGGKITLEQVKAQLHKLRPYKAPGPDGIPNVVLTKCAQLIADRLLRIYEAIYEKKLFFKPWKSFTTVVLRKPGKPRYDIPKAYRPIALLSTMWKVLTAIIAEQLTFVTEKHQLLPARHFGGRPGHTTTDAMHLLTHEIKAAWRAGKVTSVLFLDIEGAFPNAVPSRLVHNMRKRGAPVKITNFVHNMLRDRETILSFDGYKSEHIMIDNGIGQGDPLSMALYQYYNADLLEIPKGKSELAMAYVDDGIMQATAKTFEETHEILRQMVVRKDGVADWSRAHNSPLEYSKLALIDFAHRNKKLDNPPLQLPQIEVKSSASTKYLGVMFDRHLNWKHQREYTVGKGTKWATQIRRIARTTWGISPKHARKLYISVAIPRILYAADVWSSTSNAKTISCKGNSEIDKKLTSIQRVGTIAITGGLKSSPTDVLDALAFLLPAPMAADKSRHRAMVRMAMLPKEHPLYGIVNGKRTRTTKKHRSPINNMVRAYQLETKRVEKIPAMARDPTKIGKLPFSIHIAENRTDSISEDNNTTEEIRVYTDGSALNGKVGVAAILTRPGRSNRTL